MMKNMAMAILSIIVEIVARGIFEFTKPKWGVFYATSSILNSGVHRILS
jgi:hypothetical protein